MVESSTEGAEGAAEVLQMFEGDPWQMEEEHSGNGEVPDPTE